MPVPDNSTPIFVIELLTYQLAALNPLQRPFPGRQDREEPTTIRALLSPFDSGILPDKAEANSYKRASGRDKMDRCRSKVPPMSKPRPACDDLAAASFFLADAPCQLCIDIHQDDLVRQ